MFGAYAMHTQEMEDTINEIVEKIRSGEIQSGDDIELKFSDAMSEEDLNYIFREVQKRI